MALPQQTTYSLLTLTPFVPNKHWAASMQSVYISLTISMEIPPEDGSFLWNGKKKNFIYFNIDK